MAAWSHVRQGHAEVVSRSQTPFQYRLHTGAHLGEQRNSYRYQAAITEEAYGKSTLAGVIKNYFDDSYLSAVSAFVKEKKITVDDLRELIEQIEQGK